IGDVAGHGLRAAALMGQLRNSLRAYAIEGHPPAIVVDRLNRLVRDLEQGWMATLLYMVMSPDESKIRFANAGHMPALVRELGGAGQPRDDVAFVAVHTVPLSGERLALRLPAEPKALSSVRRALVRWLEQAGASEEDAYSVQLATHEACTNAIEHGYRFG